MSTATTVAPPATATATETATRVYVGGVGESVGEEDLRKIFGALGTIGAVEIVRTKGRGFAYIDFVPATQNSLSKLFSKVTSVRRAYPFPGCFFFS